MNGNFCVCCGEIIPEGNRECPNCLCYAEKTPDKQHEASLMISANELKKRITKVKKCFSLENNDYMTGYISAISFVEGLIAILQGGGETPVLVAGQSPDDKTESGLLEE